MKTFGLALAAATRSASAITLKALVINKNALSDVHFNSYEKPLYKKLILGQPNGQETFSTHATKIKRNLFLSFFCYDFEDTITNFNKNIFIKASFHGANSYNQVKTKFKIVVTHFQLSNPVFFLLVVLFHKKSVKKLSKNIEYSK